MIIFEDENYLIKICVAIFVSLSDSYKEKDINSIMVAANNLHLSVQTPEKIIKEADKLKITNNKISILRSSFKNRASASF